MSAYQTNMTVNDLIAHLMKVAGRGHGDRPVTIDAYRLDMDVDVDRRPNFPRAEALSVGRVSADQRSTGATIAVVLENWG